MATQEINIHQLRRGLQSLAGRRARLRETQARFRGGRRKSPIAEISVFQAEIDRVDDSYRRMQESLENAKVTIEI